MSFAHLANPIKLGRGHVAFIELKLSDTSAKILAAFSASAMDIKEIEQGHMIAGSFGYLLTTHFAFV